MSWKIIDLGRVPADSPKIDYECECGSVAPLPAMGLALAQIGAGGVVFDNGPHAMPREIKCTICRRHFVLEEAS